MKKFLMLLVVCMCTGLVIAGCGDDDKDSSSSSENTPAATTATPAPTDTTGGGSADAGGDVSADPTVQAAVESCKQGVDAAASAGLKPDSVTELKKTCDEAATGDAASVKAAVKKVCLQVVEDTVPAAAQEQAKATCNQY